MISVLIPVLNEAAALARLLPALPERIDGLMVRPVVINDGSTDETAALARAHGAEVVDLWPNHGKSAALRAGLAALASRRSACVVFMDGDGQHDPDDLAQLVGPVLAGECDIACGSRYLTDGGRGDADGGRGDAPVNRYLVRRLVIRSLRRRIGTHITDPFSGYRCLAPAVASAWQPRGERYEAELELLFDAVRNGWVLREVPVARIYTGQCSKMGARHGALVGRLQVMQQYATTIRRKSGELADGRSTRGSGSTAREGAIDAGT